MKREANELPRELRLGEVRRIPRMRTSPKRSSRKFSNHSELGCREGSFAAPAFWALRLGGVYF
jgi:hypothetical protein